MPHDVLIHENRNTHTSCLRVRKPKSGIGVARASVRRIVAFSKSRVRDLDHRRAAYPCHVRELQLETGERDVAGKGVDGTF